MRLRVLSLLVVVSVGVGGCSKKSSAPAGKLIEQMPRVDVAAALAPTDVELPRVVAFLAADGTLTAADRSKSWETFLSQDPRRKTVPADARYLRALVEMAQEDVPIARTAKELGDPAQLALRDDEPPPPEPEDDEVDDDGEESGGTGTAMALDEGKMGKKDGDRAEGQYKMRNDPQLARQQAIEQARAGMGIRRSSIAFAEVTGGTAARAQALRKPFPVKPPEVPPELPRRLGDVLGEVLEGALPPRMPRLLVIAAPAAKATALVDVLAENKALLAVAHQGTVKPLRVAFLLGDEIAWNDDWQPWMEVRVTAAGLHIEAVPGVPVALAGAVDAAALGKAFTDLRAARGITNRLDVDVLVGPDVDVQRLVDVLVALDGAGARMFAIGRIPPDGDAELGKRGKRLVIAQLDRVQTNGELDADQIKPVLIAATPAIKTCYEQALAAKPDLAGKILIQFLVKADGNVGSSNGAGADDGVVACIKGVVIGLTFPSSDSGGVTQVNAPFILRH